MGDPHEQVQVILPPEEFAEDLELRLGRANGNIYHRRPGIEGVHDGQYMIRLKKKRFIIIDYGIIPNESDHQAAVLHAGRIVIPNGAGSRECTTPGCSKVGVPVLLYDSHPGETQSLYMRAGLCFTCQRNLNEKRRTQKKRKRDSHIRSPVASMPVAQRNGNGVDLSAQAITANGHAEDTKHASAAYFPEINNDLQDSLLEAAAASQRLVAAVACHNSGTDPTAAAFAAAVAAAHGSQSDDPVMAASAAMAAASTGEMGANEDIITLYEKAITSMNKGVFLLSQWKASWDAAVAAAVTQEAASDLGLADAVASAAAVAAASTQEGQNQASMVPLALAAETKGETEKKEESGGVFSV